MSQPTKVIDAHSNHEEFIERTAKHLGVSQQRHKVFDVVYGRNRKPLTFDQIKEKLGDDIPNQSIRNQLNHLAKHGLASRTTEGTRVVYGKIEHISANKAEIKRFALNKKLRDSTPTKRRPAVTIAIENTSVRVPLTLARARFITIDEIDSFTRVRDVKSEELLGNALTEDEFKLGVQELLGELGQFKDWGGEQSDLLSSRILIDGKRHRVAFAFKGPGLVGKLTISKMGKNGDQCPRLFQEPADVYIVQHCREIVSAVLRLVETHAQLKSVYENREILYSIIDGNDSMRLVKAYPEAFGKQA